MAKLDTMNLIQFQNKFTTKEACQDHLFKYEMDSHCHFKREDFILKAHIPFYARG